MTTPSRWDFETAGGAARLLAELAQGGIAWVRAPELVEAADRDPWGAAARILGEPQDLVERQPIRAVPGGRTFSSGAMAAPFHSDSQACLGVTPHVQVMACRRPAAAGGENLYLDTWALLGKIEREAPDLFTRLFDDPRRFPFVFGDVLGPTVSFRGGSLVFTHSAMVDKGDAVAPALDPFLLAAEVVEVRPQAGDLVVIHNHRLLHGRRAFPDPTREFVRLLVWRPRPFPAPEPWLARAARVGVIPPTAPDAEARPRLRVVLELLRGVPAGVLSRREGVPEAELYAWRDRALASALAALTERGHDQERA